MPKPQAARKKKTDDGLPAVSFWKVFKAGLKICFKSIPILFIVVNLISILHGVSQGFSSLITQQFYDNVEQSLRFSAPAKAIYLSVITLGAVMIGRELLNGIHNFLLGVAFSKSQGEATRLIHAKMGRLDPVCLEDTKVQDQINKAEQGSSNTISILNVGVIIFTFYIPYFIFMSWYLSNVSPKFILAIVLVFIPSLFSQLVKSRIVAKFEDEAAPVRRQFDFYNSTMTDRGFFKETRLLGAHKLLLGRLLEICRDLSSAERRANKRNNRLELIMTVLSSCGWGGIMYLLVTTLLAGEITIGAFAAVFGSLSLLFGIMNEVFANVGNLAQNYVRFMDLPERGGTAQTADSSQGIVLDNVSFRYPGAAEPSINGVSLTIRPGETIAVVGENGAGKSTLVRLAIGMYKPTEGRVTVRGLDTKTADGASLFRGLSGVFQKYQRYLMLLGENVNISQLGRAESAEAALRDAGVELDNETFPEGLSTMLSREFDGVDLSGGQWQRIAIARGLYRTHELVVLDEPTAAIDPIEESRVYKQFMEISKDKTAIIVTHRLGSVKAADRVVVMDKGKIVAAAPHTELLQCCALYSEMYNAQAMWYES